MRSSLSLQRSLFTHQQKQIAAQVQGASPAFRAYERRYRAATRSFRKVLSPAEVASRVVAADVVYVGDYHTLRLAQAAYLELVRAALESGRRVVLALEFVEGRRQAALDAFLQGRIGEKTFLARIGHPYRGPFDIWPGFAPVLALARRERLQVVAIDRRAAGPRSLEKRDRYAAQRIASAASAEDRPLVLVLMGQYHVAPAHLPRCVERELGRSKREHLVVYQNAEGVWWKLAERGLSEAARAVEVSASELCVISASPVVCQRSFLDYVEAESGDAPLEESGIALTFRHLARDIGRLVGVPVRRAVLDDVQVMSASDMDVLARLARRARFSRTEMKHLERHVLSRESAWIPRARAVWLASLSLNHAAEEAAHFVRYAAVGDAMERARPKGEAFWARALEEALGFFGSRLVNPARHCTQLDEWAGLFQHGAAEQQRIAAFVLALSAAVHEGPIGAAARLLPLGSLSLFNGVSHALGYLLGDALARAFARGRVSRAEIRQLFVDRFDDPAATFFAWSARLKIAGAPRRAQAPTTRGVTAPELVVG